MLSIKEAIKKGMFEPRKGKVKDPKTGKWMSIDSAVKKGFIVDPRLMKEWPVTTEEIGDRVVGNVPVYPKVGESLPAREPSDVEATMESDSEASLSMTDEVKAALSSGATLDEQVQLQQNLGVKYQPGVPDSRATARAGSVGHSPQELDWPTAITAKVNWPHMGPQWWLLLLYPGTHGNGLLHRIPCALLSPNTYQSPLERLIWLTLFPSALTN